MFSREFLVLKAFKNYREFGKNWPIYKQRKRGKTKQDKVSKVWEDSIVFLVIRAR